MTGKKNKPYKPIVMQSAKDEFKGALDAMVRNAPQLIAYNKVLAGIRRQSFLDHIKEGFTEEQALELCKKVV